MAWQHTLAPARVEAPYWSRPTAQPLADLRSAPSGLTAVEARARLAQAGPNLPQARGSFATWRLLLRQFSSPLVLILLFAAGVSAFLHEWVDMAVVVAIVVARALIAFLQEHRASRAVAALRARLAHMVTTLRDGRPATIPAATLVPGDSVLLAAGSLVPADGVLLAAKDLYVTEAALTGETFPVLKQPEPVAPEAAIGRRSNCVFLGTTVHSGAATLLVVQTGGATAYGQIAGRLRPPETEFERGIRHFGMLLTQVMVVLILIVFTANVITVKPPIEALLFAIALAVGISPELLPAIISINLSKGARVMARGGVIVRRLSAIENLGSMDVLCTDKTGTLTGGVIQLDGALDPEGEPSGVRGRGRHSHDKLQRLPRAQLPVWFR